MAVIGYMAQVFPHLTMTFVYRELMALRAEGLDVRTFSTWRPTHDLLSDEAKPLMQETFYIFPMDWRRFVRCHLRYALTRPVRYFGTLLFCVTRWHTSWATRKRTLLHFGQAAYLADEVERVKLAHLHVHFALNATTLALIVARLTGISFSFTAHANDIFVNPILLPEKIAAARFVIAISEYNARFLYNICPTEDTRAKTQVVRCGIDVTDFHPVAQRPPSEKPTIVAVGRLVEKKGHADLIQACKLLVDRGYDLRCYIIGDGPQEQELRRQIEELKLATHISLEGIVFQEQLKWYLAQADIIALACTVGADNDMDGIPNSLMEGMAMEIPAVSTRISGIPELIEHMQTGLLVQPRNPEALADALALLLDDPELRRRLGRAGRAKVAAEYEIRRSARLLRDLYRQQLGPEVMAEGGSVRCAPE